MPILILMMTFMPSEQLYLANAVYHFHNLAGTPLSIFPTSNTTSQNIYYTPVGMNGISMSMHEPSFVQNGVLIEHNRYLISNGPHRDDVTDNYYQYHIWMYYIQGELGNFFNLDTLYATTNMSSINLAAFYSGGVLKIDITIPNMASSTQIPQGIVTGWNLITVLNS